MRFRVLRRRQLWWPTVWGWSLIVAALAALVVAAAAHGPALLAPTEPARGARTLIVEGWLRPAELDWALERARRGGYERILTTGGPLDPWIDGAGASSFAARAAAYLKERAPPGLPVIAVPAPETELERTHLSARMAREWLVRAGPLPAAVDVVSANVHTRRTWLLYRMAFGPQVEVGALATPASGLAAAPWWRSSVATKTLLGEVIGLAWTRCCFWPEPPG